MRVRFIIFFIPIIFMTSLVIKLADAGDRSSIEDAAASHNTYGQQIMDFCNRILPDYQQIKARLVQEHPDWPARELALNLMDIGRGQISGEADPSLQDLSFIANYVSSLNFENPDAALFTAYSGGCVMGLVVKDKLPARHFMDALKLSAHMAQITFGD
ncbi:MAG: hypothetical protein WC450_06070 [Candidatus Omnitrophota bacterium]|jgi:hypothetical protein